MIEESGPEPAKVEEKPKEAPSISESTNGTQARKIEAPVSTEDAATLERERQHLIKRRSSPLVRKMARELNIDIEHIEGTGRHGRVTKRDLESFLEDRLAHQKSMEPGNQLPRSPKAPSRTPPGMLKLDTVSGDDPEKLELLPPQEVNVTMMRRQIAEQMVKSVNNIPQAFTVHEVDFTQLEKLRIRYKHIFEAQFEARLTPLVFLMRAVADALIQCPYINASWGGDRIILHQNVNIGIAVAIEGGLVVPVLKGVESMSLAGIARGVRDIAARARTNKLSPDDMQGATFTITSPGQLGAILGIPIVNRPQGGIMHFGAIHKIPAVITGPDGEDTIAIRTRAMLTLGIDHRLIDGWEADKFMVHVKERIQRTDFGLSG